MTDSKWAKPIAMATVIAKSEWKRQLEGARDIFKTWKEVYPRGTELDWSLYRARQGIRSLPAKHVWKDRQKRRVPKGHGSQNCQDERPKICDQNGDTLRSSSGNGYVRDQKTTGYTQANEKTEASYMTETMYQSYPVNY